MCVCVCLCVCMCVCVCECVSSFQSTLIYHTTCTYNLNIFHQINRASNIYQMKLSFVLSMLDNSRQPETVRHLPNEIVLRSEYVGQLSPARDSPTFTKWNCPSFWVCWITLASLRQSDIYQMKLSFVLSMLDNSRQPETVRHVPNEIVLRSEYFGQLSPAWDSPTFTKWNCPSFWVCWTTLASLRQLRCGLPITGLDRQIKNSPYPGSSNLPSFK